MKYIVMSNSDPLLIVNSENDAFDYVESIKAGFLANGEKPPRIHYVKCKNESDFSMLPSCPSLSKMAWVLFWLALFVANAVPFLMEDSMKNGICMLICLMFLLKTNRSDKNERKQH